MMSKYDKGPFDMKLGFISSIDANAAYRRIKKAGIECELTCANHDTAPLSNIVVNTHSEYAVSIIRLLANTSYPIRYEVIGVMS